jgi:hypothetical protein
MIAQLAAINYLYHTKNSVTVSRRKTMTRSCRIAILSDYTKKRALISSHHEQSSNPNEIILPTRCRIGILSDYTKKRALVSSHHEQSSNPNEIILPSMASSVECQKNKKGKSFRLNFQREKRAQGLRSTLRREQSVSRGLGLGIYRESSVSRRLGVGNLTSRVMQGREEEIQFDFPKRPRTKRQRQRDDDKEDGGASTRTGIKIVYDSETKKHSIVSDVVAVFPVKQSRRASSVIFHRGPSFDDKKEIPMRKQPPYEGRTFSGKSTHKPNKSPHTFSPPNLIITVLHDTTQRDERRPWWSHHITL